MNASSSTGFYYASGHGPLVIIFGAIIVKNILTLSAKKQEIIDWLNVHDIAFSNELRKLELLELVKINKKKVPFSCIKIAEQYGHEVNLPFLIIVNSNLLKAFGFWKRTLKNVKEYFKSDENIQLLYKEFDTYDSADDDYVT
ncbi:hypothetical protein C1645_825435 [Glomus cerebriforme]|uniref:Uncharacterized protein n=1 Tax=Glomus cerebriforme TaxID=658196 RepID=A0A397T1Y6_9GLOM|nr:hypothetical protein C1645_825435 [Glomus cerebriforme]